MNPHKKYGLLTAISIVVGSVIGSGIFYKAEEICLITNADNRVAVGAWITGGAVMLLCLFCFASITNSCEEQGGVCAIAKQVVGDGYSYYAGVFMATIYYPSLVSVLSYLSARYTLLFFGAEEEQSLHILLCVIYLVVSFGQNMFFPTFCGRLQVITTCTKLLPLVLMIIFGITRGVTSGTLAENMKNHTENTGGFFPAVTASFFAYEGWITATSIGRELKNSRKNMPVALIAGGVVICCVYVLYYIGIMGAVKGETLINYGAEGINIAFRNILGRRGQLLCAFVAVSCFGALNALVMGSGRAFCELAHTKKDGIAQMPKSSFIKGGVVSILWLFYLLVSHTDSARGFLFDSSALPVVSIYAVYIPILWKCALRKNRSGTAFLYIAGICACLFAIMCGISAQRQGIVGYIMLLVSVMLFGSLFYNKK